MRYEILDEAGKVVNQIVADEEFVQRHHPGRYRSLGYSHQELFFMAAGKRQERDSLLLASDVMVLPDRWAALSAEKQQAWSAYRQALRDVPQQPGFPENVTWPVKPE